MTTLELLTGVDRDDLVRATATFANSAGTATDPTTVTVYVKNPAGTLSTYIYGTDAEVVKSATGIFYIDVDCNKAGEWHVRFKGTGAVAQTVRGIIRVETDPFS